MTKKRLYLGALALLGLVSVWLAVATPQTAGEKPNLQNARPLHLEMANIENPDIFNIDHFKVYRIEPQNVSFEVSLRGQFEGGYKTARLHQYTRFLNPVNKDGGGIIDKRNHLNWYEIETEDDPTRQVSISNQFGQETFNIDRAVALLAPAEKVEDGSGPPQRLGHYKVYVVLDGKSANRDVKLEDQFGQENNFAMQPAFFAVPVEKLHGSHFPKIFPNDHIVFYELKKPQPMDRSRPTIDQFGKHDMKTKESVLLGVPSWKIAWR